MAELRHRDGISAASASGIDDDELATTQLTKLVKGASQIVPDDAAATCRPRAGLS
jgi:hypothetical protein